MQRSFGALGVDLGGAFDVAFEKMLDLLEQVGKRSRGSSRLLGDEKPLVEAGWTDEDVGTQLWLLVESDALDLWGDDLAGGDAELRAEARTGRKGK